MDNFLMLLSRLLRPCGFRVARCNWRSGDWWFVMPKRLVDLLIVMGLLGGVFGVLGWKINVQLVRFFLCFFWWLIIKIFICTWYVAWKDHIYPTKREKEHFCSKKNCGNVYRICELLVPLLIPRSYFPWNLCFPFSRSSSVFARWKRRRRQAVKWKAMNWWRPLENISIKIVVSSLVYFVEGFLCWLEVLGLILRLEVGLKKKIFFMSPFFSF